MSVQRVGNLPFQSPFTLNSSSLLTSNPWIQHFNELTLAGNAAYNPVDVDTHANRLAKYLASNFQLGSIFWETDRTVIYVLTSGAWTYAAGVMQATQATLPTDLGAADVGLLVNVKDYGHLLMWSGSAWGWAPGDAGSAMMGLFDFPPNTGWARYQGQSVNYLLSTGALAEASLPNLAGMPVVIAGCPTNLVPWFRL